MVWATVMQNQSPSCFTFLIFDYVASKGSSVALVPVNDRGEEFVSALQV